MKQLSPLRTPYWQQPHLGRLLGYALQRFDNRVLTLMVQDDETPLALSNLAKHHQISAAHIHITRHLPPQGCRLSELAQQANISKQSMSNLVNQCEAWGIIERVDDPHDARAKIITYTSNGLAWLHAFTRAVQRAEEEFSAEIGEEITAVVKIGLEIYASGFKNAT